MRLWTGGLKAVFRITWRGLLSYNTDHASSFAAAVAYYTLFSIFPLALFFIGFSGYFITRSQRDAIVGQVANLFGGASTGTLYHEVELAMAGRAGLGLIGLIGALWGASAVFGAIRTGLNAVWHVTNGRPWWKAKLLDLASVIGLLAMLGLALALTLVLTNVTNRIEHLFGARLSGLATFTLAATLVLVPVVLAFFTFLALYVLASPRHIHLRHVWLGALISAVGYQAISLCFGLYVSYFAHYDRVYGSLGAVIGFLFFAYLMGSLILLGAEISEAYMESVTGLRAPERALVEANRIADGVEKTVTRLSRARH